MLSALQLAETNNAIKSCHQKLNQYHKIGSIKNKLLFLSSIWHPSHLTNPTKYTPAIVHIHLSSGYQYAMKSIPLDKNITKPPSHPTLNKPPPILPTSPVAPTSLDTSQHSLAIQYQLDIANNSRICAELLELHIFWLQAQVDLFLQSDLKSPDYPTQQLLYRVYDQIVRYITADLYTPSSTKNMSSGSGANQSHNIQNTQNGQNNQQFHVTSPSLIQFIPHSYLVCILGDLITSPSFISSVNTLLPTHRGVLISPFITETGATKQTSDEKNQNQNLDQNSSKNYEKKYHNIFTLLFHIYHDRLNILDEAQITKMVGSLLTAFPTLLPGFTHVATHPSLDVTTIGQLIVDIYLLRGYHQRFIQEEQFINICMEQLFHKWTIIALQRGGNDPSNITGNDKYSKIARNWSQLTTLPQNLLRSVLNLYSVDQVADKLMRKGQFLTKKKQIEFSEKMKHLTVYQDTHHDGRSNHDNTHGYDDVNHNDGNLGEYYDGLCAENGIDLKNNQINNQKNNFKCNRSSGLINDSDDDRDSRADDFDDFSDDLDNNGFNSDHDHSQDDFNHNYSPTNSKNNHHPKKTTTPIPDQNPPSPNKTPLSTQSPNRNKPVVKVQQCSEYDVDEINTFRLVDENIFFKPNYTPRYLNSQQYLLQTTVQTPSLMDKIENIVQDFDTFRVTISIDAEGYSLVQIHPPNRQKVFEMNEDDYEYVERKRLEQVIGRGRKGGKDSNSNTLGYNNNNNGDNDEYQQLIADYGLNGILSPRGGNNRFETGSLFSNNRYYDGNIHDTNFLNQNNQLGEMALSVFSGNSAFTLGGGTAGFGIASVAGRSLTLTSITTTQTIKSLLSPSVSNLASFSNFGPESSPNNPNLHQNNSNNVNNQTSFGFLASPTQLFITNAQQIPLSPTSLTNHNNNKTNVNPQNNPQNNPQKTTISSRNTQFTFTKTPQNTSTTPISPRHQNQLLSPSPTSQNQKTSPFITTMLKFHKNRTIRSLSPYLHPQQQYLLSIFSRANRESNIPDPWNTIVSDGEGLSEWNPAENHFYSIILKMLPLYPILITFLNNNHNSYNNTFLSTPYSMWAKLLHLLFGRRMGRREFVVEGGNSSNFQNLLKNKKFDQINNIIIDEIKLSSQMLFIVGSKLENVLISFENTYPSLNMAKLYENEGFIDSSSNSFHENTSAEVAIKANVVTYGGYIHSIRSLYSLLKYTMIRLQQIINLINFIDQNNLQIQTQQFNEKNSFRQVQFEKLKTQSKEDYETELNCYNASVQTNPNLPKPILEDPILPEISPNMDEINQIVQNSSVFASNRGEIEEIAFQCYYLYQRHFAFSLLSLPNHGGQYKQHALIAGKLAEIGENKGGNGESSLFNSPNIPKIDWTTTNQYTSSRSALVLYPQNNIVNLQLEIHQQIRLLGQEEILDEKSDEKSVEKNEHNFATQNPPQIAPISSSSLISATTSKIPTPHASLVTHSYGQPQQQRQQQQQQQQPTSSQNYQDQNAGNNSQQNSQKTPPIINLHDCQIRLTPELRRKINAVDYLLSRTFPHYSTDPRGDFHSHKAITSVDQLQQKEAIFSAGFSTFCVNRIWIDFDLLWDCYSISQLLKIDLMLIDEDKVKLGQLGGQLSNRGASFLYYLDIFTNTPIDRDVDNQLDDFEIDSDGVVTVLSQSVKRTDRNKKNDINTSPQAQKSNQLDRTQSFGSDPADQIESDPNYSNSPGNKSPQWNSPTKPKKNGTNQALPLNVSFIYQPSGQNNLNDMVGIANDPGMLCFDDDDGDDDEDDQNGDHDDMYGVYNPQTNRYEYTNGNKNGTNSQKKTQLHVAHSTGGYYDGSKMEIETNTTKNSPQNNTSTLPVLSHTPSDLEIEYKNNDVFKCIERGENPDLCLFEYVKPSKFNNLDEFLNYTFYNDFNSSTLFSRSLGYQYDPNSPLKPAQRGKVQSFVGRSSASVSGESVRSAGRVVIDHEMRKESQRDKLKTKFFGSKDAK